MKAKSVCNCCKLFSLLVLSNETETTCACMYDCDSWDLKLLMAQFPPSRKTKGSAKFYIVQYRLMILHLHPHLYMLNHLIDTLIF